VEATALTELGLVHVLTGDHPAAACAQQALALCRDLGDLRGQAYALNCLGMAQQIPRDRAEPGRDGDGGVPPCQRRPPRLRRAAQPGKPRRG